MNKRFAAIAAATLLAAGCQSHSLNLDLYPNPLIVGLMDRQATIHARVTAHGFGKVPMGSVQFAVFNQNDTLLASDQAAVDQSMPATPLGYVVDKQFTFPINGLLVAATGARYIMVKVLDPYGNMITQSRLNVVVHALKDLPIPPIITTPPPTPR